MVVLCTLLFVALASGRGAGGSQVPADPYWLGPYFAGMKLTGTGGSIDESFSYGDCELPEGEGGCSPPAQIQTTSSCARNPIGLDRIPYDGYLLRGGGLAAVYESTGSTSGPGVRRSPW